MTRDTEERDFETTADEAVDVTAGIDETAFRREYPIIWWLTLLGPFVLTASVVFFVWEFAGPRVAWRLVSTAVATFFLFGKFVILGGSDGDLLDAAAFFTAEQLMLIVLYMDVMTGCLLVFHLGFLFRLPMVGEKLNELVQDGNFILRSNRWMKLRDVPGTRCLRHVPVGGNRERWRFRLRSTSWTRQTCNTDRNRRWEHPGRWIDVLRQRADYAIRWT